MAQNTNQVNNPVPVRSCYYETFNGVQPRQGVTNPTHQPPGHGQPTTTSSQGVTVGQNESPVSVMEVVAGLNTTHSPQSLHARMQQLSIKPAPKHKE